MAELLSHHTPLLCPSPWQRGQAVSSMRDVVGRRVARAPRLHQFFRFQVAFEHVGWKDLGGGSLLAVHTW